MLQLAARHARVCLILGLLAGLCLPGLAAILRPWIPHLVALLLFLSALRIGPARALGGLGDASRTLRLVAIYQIGAPLFGLGLAASLGLASLPLAFALILMLAAPPVTGAPNFTALMGHDPAPPMRLLILGTALFPLTVLPVLWLLPGLGDAGDVIAAALRLVAVIAVAVGAGFAVRHFTLQSPTDANIRSIDGASAITLAIVVVGLMAALGPALRSEPQVVALWMMVVMVANIGLQLLAWTALREVGLSIASGNRNIALFLVALPPEVSDPILIFVGCYQIPMYLTPILMARIYR